MRTVLRQLSPPSGLTDPFPAQWLRSIQSAGHPVFDSPLGGTWRDIYISDSWKISSDGVIRQGGHSIEFGIRVGKSIKPLHQLAVMVQWCWPKVSLRIRGKSAPDRVIRVIPALFTDSDAAGGLAIELTGKESGIAIRTRGLYASIGTLPTADGWSMIPPQPVPQRIVFSRIKPTDRMSKQFAHASSCVTCLDDSDIPSWLIAAMSPALQYSTMRPHWVQALLGFPISRPDINALAIQQCQTALVSGVEGAIADFYMTLDARFPKLPAELATVLKWLTVNHPVCRRDIAMMGTQLGASPVANSVITHALVYAVSRTSLPRTDKTSAFSREIRAGSLLVSPGLAAATFAANGEVGLAAGASYLTQPSEERHNNQLTSSEWLALLYAIPSGLALSGCLALDASASSPLGVRSPLLSSTFAGTLTSRKEIEANRVRISVLAGFLNVHSVRTWRTDTASSSALALHISKSGLSTNVAHTIDGAEANRIKFSKSVRIGQKESLVISTVGAS